MDKELLNNIAEILADKKNLMADQAIAQGSVGIAFFLFHYYKMSRSEACADTVSALVMEMMERLTTKQELLQRDELLDISWFLKYLSDDDFLDLETDDLLTSIDDIYADAEYSVGYPDVTYLLKVIRFFIWRRKLIQEDQHLQKIDQIITRFVKETGRYYQQTLKEKLLESGITNNVIQKRTFHTAVRTTIHILTALHQVIAYLPAIVPQFLNEISADVNEMLTKRWRRPTDNGNRCLMEDATDFYIYYAAFKYGINSKDNEILAAGYPQSENLITSAKPSDLPDLLLATSCLHLLASDHPLPVATKHIYTMTLAAVAAHVVSFRTLNALPNLGLRDGIAGAGLLLLASSGEYNPDLENIFPFN